MTEDIKGRGGAFEIGNDGAVQRTEGTAEAPKPLPPTATAVVETTVVDASRPVAAKPLRGQTADKSLDGKKD